MNVYELLYSVYVTYFTYSIYLSLLLQKRQRVSYHVMSVGGVLFSLTIRP